MHECRIRNLKILSRFNAKHLEVSNLSPGECKFDKRGERKSRGIRKYTWAGRERKRRREEVNEEGDKGRRKRGEGRFVVETDEKGRG